MTNQLTPWYDPKVDGQPVRVGIYERELDGTPMRYKWDGKLWRYVNQGDKSLVQELPWRGLTEPNEEKQ